MMISVRGYRLNWIWLVFKNDIRCRMIALLAPTGEPELQRWALWDTSPVFRVKEGISYSVKE